jgi:hypothetical protein
MHFQQLVVLRKLRLTEHNTSDLGVRCSTNYVDGKCIDFPHPPIESAVWEWISGTQDEFLTDTRGMYYHNIRTKELTGGEAANQLDLFMSKELARERDRDRWSLFGCVNCDWFSRGSGCSRTSRLLFKRFCTCSLVHLTAL